jgi:hypothetical protein
VSIQTILLTLRDEVKVSELAPRFACGPDKRPLTPQGFYNAKTDVDDSSWPLVGIPTGAVSGFDVVDVDLDGLCWLDANWDRLPATRTQATRSGGRHLFFNHSDGLRCSAGRISKGVDVRADGGYVIDWSREGFRVLSDAEIADWPEWLLELARKKPPAPWVSVAGIVDDGSMRDTHGADGFCAVQPTLHLRRRSKAILRQVEYARHGERNRLLNWAAYQFGQIIAERKINPEIASLLLEGAAKTNGLWHDDGPQQCLATIRSGIGAGIRDFRDRMGTNVVQFKQKEIE